jgi:hypothetical protein
VLANIAAPETREQRLEEPLRVLERSEGGAEDRHVKVHAPLVAAFAA